MGQANSNLVRFPGNGKALFTPQRVPDDLPIGVSRLTYAERTQPEPPTAETILLLAIVGSLTKKQRAHAYNMIRMAHFERPCDGTARALKIVERF